MAIKGDEGTPESVNPSSVDEEEEGLPSPPLDEGAFFAAQTTSIELSQFFDGMDEDGNPQNGGAFSKNHDDTRKPSTENHNVTKQKPPTTNRSNVLAKDNKSQLVKRQEAAMKPGKPFNADSGPGRPQKQNFEQYASNVSKLQQKLEKAARQRKPSIGDQDTFKRSDEAAVHMKLEATKRKLQERYQQAENAKKKRTIQVMELHDLPKQSLVHRNPQMRPGNHSRHWAHGRR
uniref:Putative mediator of RNA polymerase II transcription subunit 26b n=1 Tax=Rhizophora mucronata TaxID=61149 RepID=A0A2P2KTT6_RHIMU